jgi:hypothetical protein
MATPTTTAASLIGSKLPIPHCTSWDLPRTWTRDDVLKQFDGVRRVHRDEELDASLLARSPLLTDRQGAEEEQADNNLFYDEVRKIYRTYDFEECVLDSFYSDFADVTGGCFNAALSTIPGSSSCDLHLFNADDRCTSLAFIADGPFLVGTDADRVIVKALHTDGTLATA